ncbi:hypothetical protein [Azotobacter beijerinckii]|uniref:Uncharacterized protein n=1 Tax=Azotobacter beijerinckii TaxID=170623 RepID=A0A1I3ZM90_9GAMM|nr:hypothetical protein [Azotobacter beijerinckii]SFB48399.1 hypothetical protein SAMN04244571_03128 [Azotobacter beijerinckii]SFK45173.1 hypothetical protein SAMN04244574_00661 [Azotobacter beijerinckii]
MPHQIGYVDNANGQLAHYNLLAQIRHFCGGFGDIGTLGGTRTGTGTLAGLEASPASVTETWTLTCTAAAANGGTFSVVGSVSGAKPAATVGAAYDNGLLKFTIGDGATDFVVGDTFTVPVTQGAAAAADAEWEVLRYDTVSTNRELILKGSGLSRTEEIFVGFRTYQDAGADYYNLLAGVFTGFVSGNSFDTQPGARLSGVPAHNQRIDYWLTLNGQRIALAVEVGTPVYESCYVGKCLPYGRPSQYPYPVVCGGMLSGAAATRFSDTAHSGYFKGNKANMALRSNDNWLQPYCYPWGNTQIAGSTTNLRDTGGVYQLLPVELHDNTANLWGALDGIFYISGFDNATENTLTVDGADYLVIQDVWRTGFTDYYAMRLDD